MNLEEKIAALVKELTPELKKNGGVKSSTLYKVGPKHGIKCREIQELFINDGNRISKGLYGLSPASIDSTAEPKKVAKKEKKETPVESPTLCTITPGNDNPIFVWIAEPDLEPEN